MAAEPLIRESGISEAVTEHDCSSIECRPNQMGDMLAAGCKHEQGLGMRRNRLVGCGREESFPDGFSHLGPAWFPGGDHGVSCFPKCSTEEKHLCAFPATFGAFQGEE